MLFDACSVSHMDRKFQMRDRAILVLLYSCGLRRNEAVHIDVCDILFDRKRIHVRKGKNYKERYVPLNSHNLGMLEDYLFEARPLFYNSNLTDALLVSQKGNRINDGALANRLKAIISATEDEGIMEKGITMHSLRHSLSLIHI